MKAKRSNYAGLVVLLLVGAAGVYGIGMYISRTPQAQNVPAPLRRSENNPSSKPAQQPSQLNSSATILTPKSSHGELTFDQTTESVPSGADPIVFAVNRYLDNAHVFPAAARVLHVEVKEGTALVDCTEAMDRTVGSSDEATLIQGLSKTFAQFPNVKKAQFYVSGKVIETWGNVDISQGIDITGSDATSGGSSTQTGA